MKIKSILNNSALIAIKENGVEEILVGKGISFGKHAGDFVDETKIEKVFKQSEAAATDLQEILDNVSGQYFEAANTIIRYAEKKLAEKLDKNIYISLVDHIDAAIERYHNNQYLTFGMMNDLKELYPKVYAVSEWTLDYLNAEFDLDMASDEIGFLSVHFLNAMKENKEIKNAQKIMRFVHLITEVINQEYGDEFITKGVNYDRFLAHLKYLAIRYQTRKQFKDDVIISLNVSKEKREMIENCLKDIDDVISSKFGYKFSNDEVNYLRVHLGRLINKNNF